MAILMRIGIANKLLAVQINICTCLVVKDQALDLVKAMQYKEISPTDQPKIGIWLNFKPQKV